MEKLLYLLFICGLVYNYRKKIKFFFQENYTNYTKNREEAKIKKAVEKLENERSTPENERSTPEKRIEDNIQLAGEFLKDIVRYFIYQLISSLITTVIGVNSGKDGAVIVIIGSVITLIFSIKMMLSIWKAGNCLINHKKPKLHYFKRQS